MDHSFKNNKKTSFEPKDIKNLIFNNVHKILNTYKGLPQGIYALFCVKIINAMGNFVFPFLALYLKKSLEIDAKTSGLIMTVAALSFAPGSLIAGKLSDNYGRKKVFALFQTMSVVLFIPCAFLDNSILTPILLIFSAFFNGGSQPPLSAMANDLTDNTNRKKAFSLLYLGNNIGFAFGSMVAGFLFSFHTRWLFLGNFFTGFIAVIVLLKFIKETKPNESSFNDKITISDKEKSEEGGLLKALLRRPEFLFFGVLSAIYSFVYAQFPFCGSIQVGAKQYGILMSLNGFVVITMTTIIINITHNIKPLLNIAIAGAFFAIGFGMLYFATSIQLLILSTIIWTIGEILNATNSAVYIANNTPSTHRGRFNSALQIITGSGFAIAPTIMGLYIYGKAIQSAWALVFVVELVAAIMMLILYFKENKKEA
jgi:MFS family permease